MKFNTVKSKVILLLSILTLLGTIFCIVSCDNFLSQNLGKTTININLDLSKLIKNARNDDTQINGYVLKLFVYYAKNYQEGDKEIENLPLLTQTSNKVDINGTVKASLELSIASTVIFVGKLFTLNENNIESDKPLYAGKTDVYKVLPYNNNVHLVLSRDKAEIGFDIELQETHEHTFSREWSTSATHHWKVATCEHSSEVSEKAEHSYGEWITTKEATEETAGSKERVCTVCNYKETAEIAQLAHTHKFSTDWTYDGAYHWKAATCAHSSEVTDFGEHSFVDEICVICNYSRIPEGFVFVKGITIIGTEIWTPSSEVFVNGRQLTIPDLIVSDHEVTRGEYLGVMGSDPSTASAYDKDGNVLTGDDVLNNPVNCVCWYDAIVYCNKLSMNENLTPCYTIDGSTNPRDWGDVPMSMGSAWDVATCNFEANGYRLPTEAEWEWLARGGEEYTYAGSDTVNDVAWYMGNTNDTGTREVKTKAANRYGLYDMSGNVFEWCWDWFGDIDETTSVDGALTGTDRVQRGGCWHLSDSWCQVGDRGDGDPGDCYSYEFGFRVVRPSSK